ncbi:MAG: hypothetical protein ABT940_08835 [Alphaproteobacteria bacterium]
MAQRVTVDLPATDLPPTLVARLPTRPLPGARFRVTAEPIEDDASRLVALREDILAGIAELDAGDSQAFDIEDILREAHARKRQVP